MNFPLKKFESQIPHSFQDVSGVLKSFGFVPTLVGGTVRDFLLSEKMGKDWDIELRHPTHAFSKEYWKDLGKSLSQLGKVSFLPYEIIRLDIKDIQYEFSPPRIETFSDKTGHSNFEASFDLKLPFEEAVKRRDFTINAMGINLNTLELLDPLQGLVHLRDKHLYPCSDDFIKDPVRFLRALRFSQKFSFTLAPELIVELDHMALISLSANYIWSEMKKSGDPVNFLRKLTEWKDKKPELKLPVSSTELNHKWEELRKVLVNPTLHETWIVALEWIGVNADPWRDYFSVSSETCSRLKRWAQSSREFIQLKPEIFHGEFEAVRDLKEFAALFDWYFTTKQLLQKNPDLPLLKMIEEFLPDWIHLYRFEVVKDVKHIDPPLRAKYQVWNLCQRL